MHRLVTLSLQSNKTGAVLLCNFLLMNVRNLMGKCNVDCAMAEVEGREWGQHGDRPCGRWAFLISPDMSSTLRYYYYLPLFHRSSVNQSMFSG